MSQKKSPTLSEGLEALGQLVGKDLSVVSDNYTSSQELAAQAASYSGQSLNVKEIKKVADELVERFETEKVGHLISKYHVDRDRQMAVLQGLGKEVLLSVLSQGVLPAQLAESLSVSYDCFHEYLRITCTREELKLTEELIADSLVHEGLKELRKPSLDKEDLAHAKALAEFNLKLARTMTQKYAEKKAPTNAVQINNTHFDGAESKPEQVPYLNIIMPDVDNLKPLPKHRFTAETRTQDMPLEGIEDGKFVIFEQEPDKEYDE